MCTCQTGVLDALDDKDLYPYGKGLTHQQQHTNTRLQSPIAATISHSAVLRTSHIKLLCRNQEVTVSPAAANGGC